MAKQCDDMFPSSIQIALQKNCQLARHGQNGGVNFRSKIIAWGKLSLLLILLAVGIFISHAQPAPASFAYVLQADALAKSKAEAVARLAAGGREWILTAGN